MIDALALERPHLLVDVGSFGLLVERLVAEAAAHLVQLHVHLAVRLQVQVVVVHGGELVARVEVDLARRREVDKLGIELVCRVDARSL